MKKRNIRKLLAKVVSLVIVMSTLLGIYGSDFNEVSAATLVAFPGAEGYGQNATGGRGGKVVAVTNLKDDGSSGSLRWAVQQYPGEPITVVFKVSGLIELTSELRVKRNNYTLAGQTAPGDGICIMGNKVNLGGSNNFIVRHLRFRIGTMNNDPDGKGSIGIENASNFIVDHCTFGWSGEENMTIYDNKLSTIQWCIVHEGLYQSGHNKGNRGYGTQWGGESATYHHNLLAHNYTRSPRFNGARSNDKDVLIDFVNNVVYNWGKQNSTYGGDIQNNSHRVNYVNNYYKPGPARPGTNSSYFIQSSYGGIADKIAVWHMSGNYMEGSANTGKNSDNYSGLDISQYPSGTSASLFRSSTAFSVPNPVTTETSQQAYNSVLKGAGAFPRDSVDTRIVSEVTNGTASGSGAYGSKKGIIDDPSAVGGYPTYNSKAAPVDTDNDGMPDAWETKHGLNPNDAADGNLTNLSADGYTNFEMYINELAGDPVIFKASTPNPLADGTLIKNVTVFDNVNLTDWSVQANLQKNDLMYGDRVFTFASIPSGLAGAEWLKTANDSKSATGNVVEFTAGKAITVFVGLDTRVAIIPSWLDGWTKTNMTYDASNDVSYNVYAKDYSETSKVVLGSNGDPYSVCMYTVFVARKGTVELQPAVNISYISENFSLGRQNSQTGTFTLNSTLSADIKSLFSSDGSTIDNDYVKGYKSYIGNPSASNTQGDPYVNGVNLPAGTYTLYYIGSNNRDITMTLSDGSGVAVTASRTQAPIVLTGSGSAKELLLSSITFTVPRYVTNGTLKFTNGSAWLPDLYAVKIK